MVLEAEVFVVVAGLKAAADLMVSVEARARAQMAVVFRNQ